MPGNWGNLDCPACGHTHPPPEGASCDCDELLADLVCPECANGWEVRVELWRYYEIPQELPTSEEDR
jgi:hypothetical protein